MENKHWDYETKNKYPIYVPTNFYICQLYFPYLYASHMTMGTFLKKSTYFKTQKEQSFWTPSLWFQSLHLPLRKKLGPILTRTIAEYKHMSELVITDIKISKYNNNTCIKVAEYIFVSMKISKKRQSCYIWTTMYKIDQIS